MNLLLVFVVNICVTLTVGFLSSHPITRGVFVSLGSMFVLLLIMTLFVRLASHRPVILPVKEKQKPALLGGIMALYLTLWFGSSAISTDPRPAWVEAKDALQRIWVTQMAFQARFKRFGKTFEEIHYVPDPSVGRYAIFMGGDVLVREGPIRTLPPGMSAEVTETTFEAIAIGNIDDDPDLDIWIITETGKPDNIQNDRIQNDREK